MKRTILVLGATGGLGSALVRSLSGNNHVIGTFHSNKEKAEELGQFANMTPCDVGDEQSIQNILPLLVEVSVVINAITPELLLKKVEDVSSKEWKQYVDILITGTFNVYKLLLPLLKQKDSLIVHVSSVVAIDPPSERMGLYSVAKSAQHALANHLALDLRRTKARLVNVVPSFIETSLLSSFPPKMLEIQKTSLPGQQFIQPEDLSQLIQRIISQPDQFPNETQLVLRNNKDITDILGE